MKRDSLKKRELLLVGILVLTFVFLLQIVASQEALYCAEKTTNGASCLNVPQSECATGINPDTGQEYRCDRTACESTTYCSTGTCVNTATGECLPSSQSTCNPSEGGLFYDKPKDEVAECQVVCCLLGEDALLTERARCEALGSEKSVAPDIRPSITEQNTCLALASPRTKGACVSETESGRSCIHITREECPNPSESFYEGQLCTSPGLSDCSRTQTTKCVSGKHEVYFVDSCGNTANIYDANKVDDISYWNYFTGTPGTEVEVDLGDGRGNIGSRTNGACSYIAGSTCGLGNAEYGNYICQDLSCTVTNQDTEEEKELVRRFLEERGRIPKHDESWCSEPVENFENAKPGEASYVLYCYNGEIEYDLCDPYRNKLCFEDEGTGNADCLLNDWQACLKPEIETTEQCLDAGKCKVAEGPSLGYQKTEYGTEGTLEDSDTNQEINAACLPIYPPGFKFWDSEGTILDDFEVTPLSLCEWANTICRVTYTQENVLLFGLDDFEVTPDENCVALCQQVEGWSSSRCYDACTPVCLQSSFGGTHPNTVVSINEEWAEDYQNLCVSLGDCGVSDNYLAKEGYNEWLELFTGGKINWDTLPNAETRTATQRQSASRGLTEEEEEGG